MALPPCNQLITLLSVPLENILFIFRRHHFRRNTVEFMTLLGAYGFQARRDVYRATSAVILGLDFCDVIRRTAQLVTLYEKQEILRTCFNSSPAGLQAVVGKWVVVRSLYLKEQFGKEKFSLKNQ